MEGGEALLESFDLRVVSFSFGGQAVLHFRKALNLFVSKFFDLTHHLGHHRCQLLGIALRCSRLMFHLPSWRLFPIGATVFDLRLVGGTGSRVSSVVVTVCGRGRGRGIPVVPSYSAPLGSRSSLLWRNGWECGIRVLEQRAAQPAPAGWYLAGNVEAHLVSVARISLFTQPVLVAGILWDSTADSSQGDRSSLSWLAVQHFCGTRSNHSDRSSLSWLAVQHFCGTQRGSVTW
jgi:hypothetical protein